MSRKRPPTLPAHAIARASALALCMLVLAACRPEPPPADQPPEPQVRADTGLRDAIQAPQDKAHGVEKTVQDAADRQQAEIDAAEGG